MKLPKQLRIRKTEYSIEILCYIFYIELIIQKDKYNYRFKKYTHNYYNEFIWYNINPYYIIFGFRFLIIEIGCEIKLPFWKNVLNQIEM